MKWSPDHQHLASGGNDNKLFVWNTAAGTHPVQAYSDHVAAVSRIVVVSVVDEYIVVGVKHLSATVHSSEYVT